MLENVQVDPNKAKKKVVQSDELTLKSLIKEY